MTASLELAGAGLGHAAHTLGRVYPRDRALTEPVIEAIGIAVLDPEPLRRAQLVMLLRACSILQRLLISDRHPLVPPRGFCAEAIDHLRGRTIAGLVRIAGVVGECRR